MRTQSGGVEYVYVHSGARINPDLIKKNRKWAVLDRSYLFGAEFAKVPGNFGRKGM